MTELEARTICIDIDHTICQSAGPDTYGTADPIPGAREALTQLREGGWVIVLFTGRHFNHWQVTTDWLKRHEFPYDQLVFGKPPARYYVDDRAVPFEGDWGRVAQVLESCFSGKAQHGRKRAESDHLFLKRRSRNLTKHA